MGEEGGRKPSLDNPEYFLFPEDPATLDEDPPHPGHPGNSATMKRKPVNFATMTRNPEEPAVMDRFHPTAATMDRRARTISQVGNFELGKI